jgi:hypothetical protein
MIPRTSQDNQYQEAELRRISTQFVKETLASITRLLRAGMRLDDHLGPDHVTFGQQWPNLSSRLNTVKIWWNELTEDERRILWVGHDEMQQIEASSRALEQPEAMPKSTTNKNRAQRSRKRERRQARAREEATFSARKRAMV